MEEHEKLYQKSVKDRENLACQNHALKKELAELKALSAKETASLRKSVIQHQAQVSEEDQKSSKLTELHKGVQKDLNST